MRSRPRVFAFVLPLSLVAAVGLSALVPGGSAVAGGAGLGEALAGGKVITGATVHRIVHFTFDDGPDPKTTPRLLDTMDALGVRATFFFSASRFRARQAADGGRGRNAQAAAIARDALARGHGVGSHSADHVRMRGLSPAELRTQLDDNRRLFMQVFGARTFLFRPPYGSRNRTLDRMLHGQRYTTVMWNLGLADWVKRSPEALLGTFERVLARAGEAGQGGGVVLLHDTHDWSIDGFVRMVRALQARNCAMLARAPKVDGGGEAGTEELFEIADDLSAFVVPAGDAGPGVDAPVMGLSPAQLAERQRALRERERVRCAAVRATPAQPRP